MNIAFEPWIPVTMLDGSPKRISVRDALTQGQLYADLAVRPHERVALMRLLLCVSHAALDGPKDFDDWETVPQCLPEAASSYLKKWKDSFELFHPEKPWLQVAGLAVCHSPKKSHDKEWDPLTRLFLTRASGANTTLFDHPAYSPDYEMFEDSDISLALLAFQNYFVAGGKASSRMWGSIAMKNPPNPKGGPCAGKSIIYSFIRSENLLATIQKNLNTYEDMAFIYGDMKTYLGKPIWEMPIQSPGDSKAINNATKTHLGRLVPQTRILKLHENRKSVLFGAGFYYPKFQDDSAFFPDLFATLTINNKKERILLSARRDKAVWRELHSIAVRAKSRQDGSRGPLCLQNVDNKNYDLITVALLTNPSQTAELVDLIESVHSIPKQLQNKMGIQIYEKEVQFSETIARKLGWAIETYRQEIDSGWEGRLKMAGASKGQLKARLHSIATIHYWTAVEKNLDQLMAIIQAVGSEEFEPAQKSWHSMLYAVARDAYSLACAQETPRQMRAFVKGWQKLTARQDNTLHDNPDTNQEDEE